ncbi:hypothetical protein GQ43DRAFT_451947 [Delitschia confertaspora ATCC 74209]|uniref:Pyrroline-5-carboxylate reductase catalytic N-terminal domain-containing protein n=1 Tax=Delitschia confertaspora ATCC 74209 TaxID=1513339 RepID=A0A9P4JEY5_9PLEO|nr:hypothetical protein GQ43DRAFT_451947 [Delitschia confertaspora ATCC 74209]
MVALVPVAILGCATVNTPASKKRVEAALSAHSSRLTVLTQEQNLHAIQQADVIVLAFKPFKRESVFSAPGVWGAVKGKLIISILAGISTQELAYEPSEKSKTCRIENLEIAAWVFDQVGQSQFITEDNFNISAVLVGCAWFLLLLAIDGLLDAAVAEGVKRPEAQMMAMNAAFGMMKLVPAANHPTLLREKISSLGRGVRSAYTDAIMKEAEKSKSLSRR